MPTYAQLLRDQRNDSEFALWLAARALATLTNPASPASPASPATPANPPNFKDSNPILTLHSNAHASAHGRAPQEWPNSALTGPNSALTEPNSALTEPDGALNASRERERERAGERERERERERACEHASRSRERMWAQACLTCAKTLHFDLNEPERATELFEMVLDAGL
jgi:hypothetical protein